MNLSNCNVCPETHVLESAIADTAESKLNDWYLSEITSGARYELLNAI